jgi:6-phosphogluconate dehydrogenase (decarboxylating)
MKTPAIRPQADLAAVSEKVDESGHHRWSVEVHVHAGLEIRRDRTQVLGARANAPGQDVGLVVEWGRRWVASK